MKQAFTKSLAIALAAILLLTAAPLAGFVGIELPSWNLGSLLTPTADAATSGTCGENLIWTLDDEGTLTVSGTGEMTDYGLRDSSWYKNTAIKKVVLENGVTSIGNYAFEDCTSLTSVTIPDSVTSIGGDAFWDCTSLTAVHISDLAKWCNIDFGYSANPLYYARNLYLNGTLVTDLVIPDSVTEVKDYAFYWCESLTSVTIPDSVTSIGDRAFAFCESLTSVTIGDSVTSIGDYAFYGCESLTSVTIPDSVTSIGDGAFGECTSLTSVTIPDSVTSIGYRAFEDCTSLTSVTIPDSVTSIGENAFSGCSSPGEIIIENKDCQIYDSSAAISSTAVIRGHDNSTAQSYAEKYDRAFVSLDGADSDILLSGYCGDNADFSLTRGGVLQITGSGAFYDYGSASSVPWYKYRGFIKEISIADGITDIGDYAFYYCTKLTSVTIPDSVTSIGDDAFSGCISLTSVTIPDSVTSIGNYAFEDCTSLTSVTIPDSVTSIEYCAFRECTSLTSVTIPDGVKSIGNYAFRGCESLTSVTILNPDCYIYSSADTISDTATIIGYDNSTAKTYARMYNRNFVVFTCSHETTKIIPAVPATCTEGGFTQGSCCALCNTVLTAPQAIPAAHSYRAFITPPTCLDRGFTVYVCICGDTYVADYVPAIGHDYVGVVTTTPSCTEAGVMTYTCQNDESHTYTEDIAALGHTEESIPAVAATCTQTGLTEGKKCSVCGEILVAQEETPVTAHTYTASVTTPATHLQTGIRTYTCTCGDSYTEVIDKTADHAYSTTVIAPTCKNGGYTVYLCACGDNFVADHVPAIAHADTDKDGLCDSCKEPLTPALQHTEESIPAVAATCTETGLTEGKKCSVCGEILVAQEEVAALGHTEEILPAVAATCTETGLTEGKKCSVCGEILVAQEEVAALGHTEESIPAVAATCTATGLTEGKKCSVCGEILVAQEEVAALGHTEEILPAVAATCTETGLTEGKKCSICGEVLVAQEETPVTDHADTDKDGLCDSCKEPLAPTVTLGDADGDGKVTSSDARLALRAAVGLEPLTDAQVKAADADGDGKLTSSDARLILRAAVGLETL
ncbi:MAG: leucine-rich repeat protein [Clostridia bacterium]|nr:leucine-rich repeat protein [Clostridia bacterium]